jgi:tripartite ATP-independent transporter DctP family solute receptor
MKTRVGLFLGIAMLVLALSAGHTIAGTKTITMRFGHIAPENHPGNQSAKMFAENVEKRTNGAIKILVFPNNQLGSPPEILEQQILGAIDMSMPTHGTLDKYTKKFAVVMLPFLFRDLRHAHKVVDGPFMEWAAPDLDKQGLVFLSNWEWGFRNLTNNVRPVMAPDDVKGLKIRTPPEIQIQATFETLGGNVTQIPFPELFMALKQGVVDGQENPISVILHNKYYEAQKYLALTNHSYSGLVHVMSKKVWSGLTSDQQKIIKEESQKAGAQMRKQLEDLEGQSIKELEAKGMQVTRPNVANFKARMQPAYAKIATFAGKDNVEAFIKMADAVK